MCPVERYHILLAGQVNTEKLEEQNGAILYLKLNRIE